MEPSDRHSEPEEGLRDRLSRQGEEALGKLTEELAGNSFVAGAVSRAFTARERALQAQEAAMGALGVPSAADVERLTRRLRSVSQRLEGIEDIVDQLDGRLEAIEESLGGLGKGVERIGALDERLERLDSIDRRMKVVERIDRKLGALEKIDKKLAKLDRVDKQVKQLAKADGGDPRIEAVESRVEDIAGDVAAVLQAVAPGGEPPPRSQERLTVPQSS